MLSVESKAQDSPIQRRVDTGGRADAVQRIVTTPRVTFQRRMVQDIYSNRIFDTAFTSQGDTLVLLAGTQIPLHPIIDTLPGDSVIYSDHPFFRFTEPIRYGISIRQWKGKEAIFYSIIALLLFFALIKNGFHRYFMDLFRTYFRTTIKQRQIKDQLVQSPIPSLLFNLFFLFSGGMFIALLLHYFGLALEISFWMLYLYAFIGLIGIYGAKFISLKLLGWIFQVSEVIDSYIFIVFTTNKIIGIALLPFLALLAFTYGFINEATMTMSIIVVIGLFAYRFFLSYVTIRRQMNITFFHFFLYLCAFEIAPLLLINKLLFRFLGETP